MTIGLLDFLYSYFELMIMLDDEFSLLIQVGLKLGEGADLEIDLMDKVQGIN